MIKYIVTPPTRNDYSNCRKCGIREHIHLLDAKPEKGGNENSDFTRLECIACYGPGYAMLDPEHAKLSVASKLTALYEQVIKSTLQRTQRRRKIIRERTP